MNEQQLSLEDNEAQASSSDWLDPDKDSLAERETLYAAHQQWRRDTVEIRLTAKSARTFAEELAALRDFGY